MYLTNFVWDLRIMHHQQTAGVLSVLQQLQICTPVTCQPVVHFNTQLENQFSPDRHNEDQQLWEILKASSCLCSWIGFCWEPISKMLLACAFQVSTPVA
jgi:hypothetical protein